MSTSLCPYCHQTTTLAEGICENCEAVLAPALGAAHQASISPHPSVASSAAVASSSGTCPNCHQPLTASSDEICEHCGAVLTTSTTAVQSTSPAAPCPQCHHPNRPGVKFCNHCGFHLADTPDPAGLLATGLVLNNRYRVTKAIGSGGMGAVYLAEDQMLKRQVVMKALLSTGDADMIAQSIKEREFLAAIKHANIVSIYDFLSGGTHGYIVMEYVNGKTLDQILEEQGHPFAVEDAITYMLGILPAFTYLAKLGLVYCDFKPQNVMLEVLKDGTQVLHPYLLREVTASYPNHIWGVDITYIRLAHGWMYLVVVLDWYSRYIVSWELNQSLHLPFVLEALDTALAQAHPVICNSDQGSHFTSQEYLRRLQAANVQISMDGKGRALDNIFTERLWRTIKYEEVYLKEYATPREARHGLSHYIQFYNQKRPHQALQYQTPAEVYYMKEGRSTLAAPISLS